MTAVRYEHDRPGELVDLDVKKVGRIPEGGGWKAHGRQTGSSAAARKARIGYDYVHSLVDHHSRSAYPEILPDEKGPSCGAFLRRAAAYFAEHGIPRIERLPTDNVGGGSAGHSLLSGNVASASWFCVRRRRGA